MAFKAGDAYIEFSARSKKFMAGSQTVMKRTHDIGNIMKKTARIGAIAFASIGAGIALAVKSFITQENAVIGLNAALDATGHGAALYSDRLREAASEMQAVTIHGDEFLLGLMAQALNLGVSADQ